MARRRARKQLPQEPVSLQIETLSHDGRGIARVEGKTVFVDGALAGEAVSALYINKRRSFDEARAIEVMTASPDRVAPRCEHAAICGGCSLQHMAADAQIQLKQAVLLDQLRHFGQTEPVQVREPLTDVSYGYRHKARLGVKYVHKKETALVGFREKRNSFLAQIDRCHVLVPQVGLALPEFRQLIASLSVRQSIPQIEVAAGDLRTALIIRHLEPLPEDDLGQLVEFAAAHEFDLYLQPGGPATVHKVWPEASEERLAYGLAEFGLEMRFHPNDFTQVNPGINRRMVALAVELMQIEPGDRVLDLFCGLGNFTLPLATRAAEVVGVEGDEAMVARGRENAEHNGIKNVSFYGADLTQPFDQQPWGQGGFDRLLIDPPRSGAQEIVEKMTVFKPKRIVYVSCNPATLARDTGILQAQGYRLLEAGVMDMFPHTNHVESIAVFEPE